MLRSGWVRSAAAACLWAAALASGCDVLTGGCGDDLREEGPQTYTGGTVVDGQYVSSAWDADALLEFPPGMTLRLVHGLGAMPRDWQAYIAASREGDGSELVLATGQEAELVEIDAQAITVQNSTCTDLYLLVTAE
jgi:hypothetical protein